MVDKPLRLQIGRMFELMYQANGIGLAAPQVALSHSVLVMNSSSRPGDPKGERVLINPVLTARRGMDEQREGCLSLPGLFAPVRRAKWARFRAIDLDGKVVHGTVRALEARALQHELDHLDGILFIDRLAAIHLRELEPTLKKFETDYFGRQNRPNSPKPPMYPQQTP